MAARALFICLTFRLVLCGEQYRNNGLIDQLSSGMKFAKDFLGSESVALKVAEFVVRAFQTGDKPTASETKWPQTDASYDESSHKEKHQFSQENSFGYDVSETASPFAPLKHLVRLFGLQPNQISAVAVNALVIVAQMISTFLTGPRHSIKPYRSEEPSTWILNKNSRRLRELIQAAKNESLPDTIADLVKEQGSRNETGCIQLLICKVTPFIIRMQKAVFGNETGDNNFRKEMRGLRGAAIMYRHLPSSDEITARSDICEQEYKECDLND